MAERPIADVVIAGAGIIGLSVGLELLQRGLSCVVLEQHHAMRGASWAAGGMLAARDPENPPALLPLSLRSLELYPAYLEGIQMLAGVAVPLRTHRALQQAESANPLSETLSIEQAQSLIPGLADVGRTFVLLEEDSLDPRDLCRALPIAFSAAKGSLLEGTPALAVEESRDGVVITTPRERIHAGLFVNCCGAWAGDSCLGGVPVEPVKGQAVTVALAADRLRCVLRTPKFYAIPRGDGRVTVGATIEHAGFDQVVEEHRIAALLRVASQVLPELDNARHIESWAGLRPGTPDGLPILGKGAAENCWHANGHYRNGVLLAPITARVIAQAICGEPSDVSLESFSRSRFSSLELTADSSRRAASGW